MDQNMAAPFLITLAYQHVRRAIAENVCRHCIAYEFNLAPAVVERLRERPPAGSPIDDVPLRARLADEKRPAASRPSPNAGAMARICASPSTTLSSIDPLVGKY